MFCGGRSTDWEAGFHRFPTKLNCSSHHFFPDQTDLTTYYKWLVECSASNGLSPVGLSPDGLSQDLLGPDGLGPDGLVLTGLVLLDLVLIGLVLMGLILMAN